MKNIKKIAIAGAGGIGSNLCRFLFEYGTDPRNQYPYTSWDIDIFDDGHVDIKNLLHQNFSVDELGKKKVQCMADRYLVLPNDRFMEKKDFDNYEVIFCCVDSMTFRKELYEWYWKKKPDIFWIDGRSNSHQGAVFNSTLKQKQLEKYISDSKERGGCLLDHEKKNDVSHVLPSIVAGTMLQIFLNWYRAEAGTEDLPEQTFMI